LAFVATLTLLFLRALLTLWRGIAGNRAHLLLRHVHPHAALELARQFDGAVAHAHQPAYRQANRFEHTAHLAVASLRQRHAIPVVGALASFVAQRPETRRAILELDAGRERGDLLVSEPAEQAYGVFALHLVTRVHHLVGQRAVIGEQQQTGSVEIKAT